MDTERVDSQTNWIACQRLRLEMQILEGNEFGNGSESALREHDGPVKSQLPRMRKLAPMPLSFARASGNWGCEWHIQELLRLS